MPWTGKSFSKHNKKATPAQAKVGAEVANQVLERTGDEGRAARAGNAVIKRMKGKKR